MPDFILASILVIVTAIHLFETTGGFSGFPGDNTDARFNQFILEHVYQWIIGNAPQLFSPQFFYPFPGALNFSDNHFGSVLIYIVSRFLGASREIAFDVWFVVGYFCTFVASTFALRKFGFSTIATVIGAFIFTVNLPMLAQEGHAQLVYRFAIPLAALALAAYRQSRKKEDLFLVAIWTGLQFLCSIYLGVFLVLLLVALIVSDYLTGRICAKPILKRDAVAEPESGLLVFFLGVAAAVIWVVLFAVLHRNYSTVLAYGFHRPVNEISRMLPRPSSYLLADGSSIFSWLGAATTDIPVRWEHQLFPGAAAAVLASYGVVFGASSGNRRHYVLTTVFALTLLVLFTIQVSGWSLYYPLMVVPGTNAIRAVSRIILVLLFPIAVLAAFGVDALGRRRLWVRAIVLGPITILLSAEVIAFQSMPTAIDAAKARISRLTAGLDLPQLREQKRIILLLDDPWDPEWVDSVDAMILAQDVGVPTFNGYSSNLPPASYQPRECAEAAKLLTEIAIARVRTTEIPSYESLARRAMVFPLGKCGDLADFGFKPFMGRLPDALPAKIRLAIVAVEKHNLGYLAKIRITNEGDMVLPAISSSGNPVRLSWRFTSNPAAQESGPDWATRRALPEDLPPHSSKDVTIPIRTSAYSSPIYLQVSMVQEFMMWFHDHGMPIAAAAVPP